ncbi:MAG: class I SAM-dependent methyltransferase [Candidatus Eiseniibacteriota bacterium]|nr:MAG: class I SAM-dependent methyltransferase [Candidatus Eisenbacteria bacterium]
MSSYYEEKLAAERLKRCYDIAPPRVKQYLNAEIVHVLGSMKTGRTVLELGCGYGRVLVRLAEKAGSLVGIDISRVSLLLARRTMSAYPDCLLVQADAVRLPFQDRSFDLVACIQNGISAFHSDNRLLIGESVRVTKHGGKVLFSSYSDKFWNHRLEWFRLQAREGLLGEFDEEKAKNGVIECKDGFEATTVRPKDFLSLTAGLDAEVRLEEVDESSLFCEIVPRRSPAS